MSRRLEVVQVEEDEVPFTVLATSVRDLAVMGKKIINSPISLDVVVIIMAEKTGIHRRDVRKILETLPDLEKMFLKPKKARP